MSLDRFLAKQYNSVNYNCAHLVCEVWKQETGQEMESHLRGFLTGKHERVVRRRDLESFKRLPKPISPCLVLMQPFGHGTPHVGVFVRGKVIHIQEDGVRYQPVEIASIGFRTVRFYSC